MEPTGIGENRIEPPGFFTTARSAAPVRVHNPHRRLQTWLAARTDERPWRRHRRLWSRSAVLG
jgi:hypothetical protein